MNVPTQIKHLRTGLAVFLDPAIVTIDKALTLVGWVPAHPENAVFQDSRGKCCVRHRDEVVYVPDSILFSE